MMTTLTPAALYERQGAIPHYLAIPNRWAFCNQKGGVGKTASAVLTSMVLAARGVRVLLLDLDPQGAASAWFGVVDDPRLTDSLLDTALAARPNGSAPLQPLALTDYPGLALIPASLALNRVAPVLVRQTERCTAAGTGWKGVYALAQTLGTIPPDTYDILIADCAPNLDALAQAGFYACNNALVICKPEFQSVFGLGNMLEILALIRSTEQANLPPSLRLRVRGLLPTMVRWVGRHMIAQHKAMMGQMAQLGANRSLDLGMPGGVPVLESVPDSNVIARASWDGVGLTALVGSSHKTVQAYERVADFLMEEQ